MATKKPNKDATSVKFNTMSFTPPAGYEEVPGLQTPSPEEIESFNRGKKSAAVAQALEQVSEELAANPNLLRINPAYTPELLRALVALLEADDQHQIDLDLLTAHINALQRLHRAQAIKIAIEILGQLKLEAKKDPSLKLRFSYLYNLYRRAP